MKTAKLSIEVYFDEEVTDAELIAVAFDQLLETAMSEYNALEECNHPDVGEFVVEKS